MTIHESSFLTMSICTLKQHKQLSLPAQLEYGTSSCQTLHHVFTNYSCFHFVCPRVSEALWKGKPLLLQERSRRGGKRVRKRTKAEREIWHGVEETCYEMQTYDGLHVRLCSCILCMYGHVHLSIWTIVCLPESELEWHSCSKRTPTGSGILRFESERSRLPTVHCLWKEK